MLFKLKDLLSNYKVSRFIFAVSLFFVYLLFENKEKTSLISNEVIIILFAYMFLTFISIFIESIKLIDFILDITFISALLYTSFYSIKYVFILYMLVLLLAGITLPYWQSLLLALLVLIFYTGINVYYKVLSGDLFLQIVLTDFAFIVITLLGIYSKKELKKQEEYIKKLEEEKAKVELYKKLYRISAELAHEIRNPLASIHGAAQLLQEGYASERLIGIIQREAKRLDDLLRDFIQFASPLNTNKEKINLKEIIDEIVDTYKKDDLSIEIYVPSSIEVFVDKKGFYSALSNIIKNATEWANSKIVIRAKLKKNEIIISVEDDGIGIKEEDKERIFEPFFTKKLGGSGLGLAIAKRFVIENNGYILIEKSELGGAKFIISLPIDKKSNKKDGGIDEAKSINS